ncbi:MAG TPA: FHA domain-containing protein [Pseudomonadales bacterium]|nr:FHA domain-containing protein [Pseudomonadales bacterium]
MLKVQFKDGRQPGLWLVDQRVTVGKDSTNKLVINDATVSPLHVEFIQEKNWWYVEDKGSKHGTYVNGELLAGRFQLRAGDEIRLGNVDLVLVDSAQASMKGKPQAARPQTPWMLQGMTGDVRGKFYPLMGSTTLGRADDCGISIKLDTISRHHCELTVGPAGLRIKDLGSANGTQVNMKKITEAVLKAGDKVSLEGISFLVIGPKTEVEEDEDSERTVFKAVEAPPPPPKPELAAATKPQVIAEPVVVSPTVVHAEPENRAWIWAVAGAAVVILGAAVILIMK